MTDEQIKFFIKITIDGTLGLVLAYWFRRLWHKWRR